MLVNTGSHADVVWFPMSGVMPLIGRGLKQLLDERGSECQVIAAMTEV
jgi:hypothetical protein